VTNDIGANKADASSGADATPSDVPDKRPIRMVGPQFLPAR
jgi:hypothetical protein